MDPCMHLPMFCFDVLLQDPCSHGSAYVARDHNDVPLHCNPAPSNLAASLENHADDYFMYAISEGSEGTTMAPYKDVLSEADRWNIVTFLRASFGSDDA